MPMVVTQSVGLVWSYNIIMIIIIIIIIITIKTIIITIIIDRSQPYIL